MCSWQRGVGGAGLVSQTGHLGKHWCQVGRQGAEKETGWGGGQAEWLFRRYGCDFVFLERSRATLSTL